MKTIIVCALMFALGGCGSSAQVHENKASDERETNAEYHLAFADSLETAGAFQGASLVYKMLAELYPNSIYYASAVRNLGHVYVNPFNTARNDSIALYWFTKHLEIPWLLRGERARSVIISSMIRERLQFNAVNHRRQDVIDSLTSLARIQSAEVNAQSKKIAELTSDLEQTDNDLRILLEFQKNPTVARRDSLSGVSPDVQRFAEAADVQQARKSAEQTNEQLRKLREIDLRALQRRAKR
jgi:hypothetical protein